MSNKVTLCDHCRTALVDEDQEHPCRENANPHVFEVQVGKGQGSYKTRYKFSSWGTLSYKAEFYYRCINTHSGYKKRLLRDGKVLERYIS